MHNDVKNVLERKEFSLSSHRLKNNGESHFEIFQMMRLRPKFLAHIRACYVKSVTFKMQHNR